MARLGANKHRILFDNLEVSQKAIEDFVSLLGEEKSRMLDPEVATGRLIKNSRQVSGTKWSWCIPEIDNKSLYISEGGYVFKVHRCITEYGATLQVDRTFALAHLEQKRVEAYEERKDKKNAERAERAKLKSLPPQIKAEPKLLIPQTPKSPEESQEEIKKLARRKAEESHGKAIHFSAHALQRLKERYPAYNKGKKTKDPEQTALMLIADAKEDGAISPAGKVVRLIENHFDEVRYLKTGNWRFVVKDNGNTLEVVTIEWAYRK